MPRIALNGLGRIGKPVRRNLINLGARAEMALLNDPAGDAEQHALILNGQRIPLTHAKTIEAVALADLGVDPVIDCSGVFKTWAMVAPCHAAGVTAVVVCAPVKDGGALNPVHGVNHHLYDSSQRLATAAFCTTICLAPVVKVSHEALDFRQGSITTIHDVTNTRTIVDRPARDPRRARSALLNLIPTTSGSATAIAMIYPELKGRLNGHAVRVPLLNASLTDCVYEVERPTKVDEINALFKAAASGPLRGILGCKSRALVSSDFTNDPRPAIIDAQSTMVVNGTQVKIYAWYDTE
ncbi:MAG: glyceraldehyde-3-phosphate dehydrogenase [Rhodobacter sp.]|nr:glyceraldehyde-3-phosphate dehydrogenase [Rhodobacter sp.]